MNFLCKLNSLNAKKSLLISKPTNLLHVSSKSFYYPQNYHHHLNQEPHVIARRIIKCVGERLRNIDMYRWDGVPVTFKTHWNDENNGIDIRTCVLVHDSIEREFNVDIDDRKILLTSVEE